MTIYRNIDNLPGNSTSQWLLVIAFIGGIVLTAGIAQFLGLSGLTQKETVPQNTPVLIDPGFYRYYDPKIIG